ncbi:hypothetical protein [Microbulbifer sp. THAF38]|uniref:hypothetical protein n=1 Tax=Microbulbifer sp. THAF38 TaxID=2587856 RepID=UPI00126921BF|nr:hypothetical protein [Microbulbifer sp. THAF38]QFT54499.1 hypothetical protein FIU95_08030 [Microbulbifer sp. THAF38]
MQAIITLTIALLSNSAAAAQSTPEILKMYEHFTLSSAAAGKCYKPTEQELALFLANYELVTRMSSQYIKNKKPSLTDKQASQILLDAGKRATDMVYREIEEASCTSPKIQDLIKRFKVQSAWKHGKQPSGK